MKRLNSHQVEEIMKQGRSIQSTCFIFKGLKDDVGVKTKTTPTLSAAFVAPKKIFKTASARNLVKRKGRAVLREILNKTKEKNIFPPHQTLLSLQCVFTYKPEVLKVSHQELKTETEQFLVKHGILGSTQ